MAATIFKKSGLSVVFGVTGETGGVIQKFSKSASIDEKVMQDEDGDDAAVAMFNKKATGSLEFYRDGSSGVAAAQVGAALTLAALNANVGGVTEGLLLVNNVEENEENGDFVRMTVGYTRRPLVVT